MRKAEFLELWIALSRKEKSLREDMLKFAIDKILVNTRLCKPKGEIVLEFMFLPSDINGGRDKGIVISTSNLKTSHRLEGRLDFNFIFPYMTCADIQKFIEIKYDNVVFQDYEEWNWKFSATFHNYPEID